MDKLSRKDSITATITVLLLGVTVFWLIDWLNLGQVVLEMKKAIG